MSIRDLVHHDLTMEFLASFNFDRSHSKFDKKDTIQFWAFGQYHGMTLTHLSILLGLYDSDFVHMEEYAQFSIDYLPGLTLARVFRAIRDDCQFKPGQFKATSLTRSFDRYIHAILSRSLIRHHDSTGVLSQLDLLYLNSMIQNKPLHLRHVMADYLFH